MENKFSFKCLNFFFGVTGEVSESLNFEEYSAQKCCKNVQGIIWAKKILKNPKEPLLIVLDT